MITCKNCQHKNSPGAIFCTECGAQLVAGEIATHSIRTDQVAASASQDTPIPTPKPITDNAWGSLHLMDSGQILPLIDRNEYTVGRISEGQPVVPDLDLSALSGIHSRRFAHAHPPQTGRQARRHHGPRVCQRDLCERQASDAANRTPVEPRRRGGARKVQIPDIDPLMSLKGQTCHTPFSSISPVKSRSQVK